MKSVKITDVTHRALKILAAHVDEQQQQILERLVVKEMTKQTPYIVRQGDVLLERVASIPKGKKKKVPREDGRIILAHGESTGHAHAIYEADAEMVEFENGERFVVSESGISIVHEEHGKIITLGGVYRVVIQQEYSPEEIRNVTD